MYSLTINELSKAQFLAQYWQKQPLLIKGGFKNFVDPIDAEELAGLAMEEGIESRIVTNSDGWQCANGPFEDFSTLGEEHSTLLVQAVDHWHPDAAELVEPFRFIPNWRIDDLMVSYSTPGGGVGPHIDQYDVFIIQGSGKRHWRVGQVDKSVQQFSANKGLLQVGPFTAVIDVELEPGDILYIPPNAPHEGYAIEPSLNYSIGFRAPNQTDLLSAFADHLIDHDLGQARYGDEQLTERPSRGELTGDEIARLRQLMIAAIDDDSTFLRFISESLSEPKHDKDLLPLDEPLEEHQVMDFLSDYPLLHKAGGLRSLYVKQQDAVILAVEGHSFCLPINHLETVKLLCDEQSIATHVLAMNTSCLLFRQTLATLIKEGYWFAD
ncbi:cupin domain-containing protein [Pseudoalteromonas sp. T1lg22]|uniref:cupin domain-containing protein n=1 Tax=Pseudoalteromonas sp. T1lg22 TaxID=2077096 RepID=UPI000CF61724|nr:cupin domain-containing protein [Pseudoalteromonas sp. T1lg22]